MTKKLGRPVEVDPLSKRLNVRLTESQNIELEAIAINEDLPVSTVLRNAVDYYIKAYKKKPRRSIKMRTLNEAIEELGALKVYELYTDYMDKKANELNYHPYIITPANEYHEDDSKTGYVLDIYAGDFIGEYETFEEAFNDFINVTRGNTDAKYLMNAVNQ